MTVRALLPHSCLSQFFVILKEGGHMVDGREVEMTPGKQKEEKVDTADYV